MTVELKFTFEDQDDLSKFATKLEDQQKVRRVLYDFYIKLRAMCKYGIDSDLRITPKNIQDEFLNKEHLESFMKENGVSSPETICNIIAFGQEVMANKIRDLFHEELNKENIDVYDEFL
jgi:hypothetical protein